ncbi:uncharacterized protein EV420DRAFT_1473521 [Desarmillaria tabescens]|uniref:Uncharacterized protein n=1 Tax=Armillaria tabescens TaxID=1929756 RepID=A0AA39NRU9_ARMTA|nr:uncharacterized protein EV420DRAFT_1473521 [Desarmillaria tabescens]KAK0470464.1 hypothetical protein EV420DRAFT_1473521 [Desarmillaria tabescens]
MATSRKRSAPSTNAGSSQNTCHTRSSHREPHVEPAPLLGAADTQMSAPSGSHTYSSGSSDGPVHSDTSSHPELCSVLLPVPEQPPTTLQVPPMPSMQTTFRIQGYNHCQPAPTAPMQSLALAPPHSPMQPPNPQAFEHCRPTESMPVPACDIWSFYVKTGDRHHCASCITEDFEDSDNIAKQSDFGLKTSTNILQCHLLDFHVTAWLTKCEQLGIEVCTKQKAYRDAINNFQIEQGKQLPSSGGTTQHPYSKESFIDALSINVIENPHLHAIFLMLHEGLKESDIPHRYSP